MKTLSLVQGELRWVFRRPQLLSRMAQFIDDPRGAHGTGAICNVLPIAPATYCAHLAKRANPARLSHTAKRDKALCPQIQPVFDANWKVYGMRKVWRQLQREGFDVARCTGNEAKTA